MKSVKLAPMPNLSHKLRFANRYSMIKVLISQCNMCMSIGDTETAAKIRNKIDQYSQLTIFDV